MTTNKKKYRELIGLTFSRSLSNPEYWYHQAMVFNSTAELLQKELQGVTIIPYLYNSGISIELVIKAIIVAQKKEPPRTHNLKKLCDFAGITFSKKEGLTLELLTESIIWLGRYPAPNNEKDWDRYYDDILEKHIIRTTDGLSGKTMVNNDTFPTKENYELLWNKFMDEFAKTVENET